MTPLSQKLQLKPIHGLNVLDAPDGFTEEFTAFQEGQEPALLAFVTTQDAVEILAQGISTQYPGDALIWIAYPKKTSKTYLSELSRDTGWQTLGGMGYKPVRQVSLNDDWSALRFRRVAFIPHRTSAGHRRLSG